MQTWGSSSSSMSVTAAAYQRQEQYVSHSSTSCSSSTSGIMSDRNGGSGVSSVLLLQPGSGCARQQLTAQPTMSCSGGLNITTLQHCSSPPQLFTPASHSCRRVGHACSSCRPLAPNNTATVPSSLEGHQLHHLRLPLFSHHQRMPTRSQYYRAQTCWAPNATASMQALGCSNNR